MPRRALAPVALLAGLALAVVVGPAVAASAPAPVPARLAAAHLRTHWPWAICRKVDRERRALRTVAGGRRLTVLATGDSMIYPIHEVAAWLLRRTGARVVVDRRDGTGLTTPVPDWPRLAARQAKRVKPDLTLLALGGRDGGLPLAAAGGKGTVPCCDAAWRARYAARLRPLVQAYLARPNSRVFFLLLPVPREAARAPLFAAVNDAVVELAAEFGGRLRPVAVGDVVSPGGYRSVLTADGLVVHPRTPDGIHLTHEGGCLEGALVVDDLVADGVLAPAA